MKEQLEKDFKELLQMGKGALSFGESKLKEVQESKEFQNFDSDLKKELGKIEQDGKKLKDDLMSKGSTSNNTEQNNQ